MVVNPTVTINLVRRDNLKDPKVKILEDYLEDQTFLGTTIMITKRLISAR